MTPKKPQLEPRDYFMIAVSAYIIGTSLILGDFLTEDGKKCGELLVKEGHAVKYMGGAKEDVEKQHLKNRERLLKEGKVK